MTSPLSHSWNLSAEEAIAKQRELSQYLQIKPLEKTLHFIGGADISFNKYATTVYAGIIVLRFPELTEVSRSVITVEVRFPYIPGLLAFREIAPLMLALQGLTVQPDVMVLDGQGILHPRRMGVASHFGLLTGIPSIGCAKSMLWGSYEEPGLRRGDLSYIYSGSEQTGAVLRTKANTKPVYVSPGHFITLKESIEIMMACTTTYRIPEPTRLAHLLVNEARLKDKTSGDQYTLF